MRKLVIIMILLLINFNSYCQTNYSSIKKLALTGYLNDAIQECEKVLKNNPKNIDFTNLLAWINNLQSNHNIAIELYHYSLDLDQDNYDALEGLARTYLKTAQFELSLKYSNRATLIYPENTTFLYLKSQSLYALKQPSEALFYLNKLLIKEPSNKGAKVMLNTIKDKAKINQISFGFYSETYQKYYNPLALYQLEHSTLTNFGTVTLRVQKAQRDIQKGHQYELESYPRFWKGSYGYIHLAFSNNLIFPKYRYGLDLNQSVFKTYGIGIGIRSLHFTNDDVKLYKLSIEKYIKSLRFEATVFKGPNKNGSSYTYLTNVKKYFNRSSDYVYITFGNAVSPDIQGRLSYSGTIYRLKSKQMLFGFQAEIIKNTIFYCNMNLINNELPFDLGSYVNGRQLTIGSRLKF